MIGKGIVSSKPVTLSEVNAILEERKAGGEMGYEQQKSAEYASKFAKVGKTKAEKLVDGLCENEKIKRETAVKIVDVIPRHRSQLVAILLKEKCELSEKEIEAVLKTLSEVHIKRVEKPEEVPAGEPVVAEAPAKPTKEENAEKEKPEKEKKEKRKKEE